MLTHCIGGPLDGCLREDSRERFYIPAHDQRLEYYRRERFGWGENSMWVYVYEFTGNAHAMDVLFGPRSTHNTAGVQD